MSTLSNLLRQVEQKDAQLAADLAREVKALSERREFGLNFERHTPETVELPGRPIRKGDKVRFLAERGESPKTVDQRLWRVRSIARADEGRVATVVRQDAPDSNVETTRRRVEDLVVVAEFRDPIYPGLTSTGKVERGGDKPFHTVINAENFHALQALLYTHEGKVDAIYLDPPYNTGARDWKYNNDYVDSDDIYRHSKWLAFMERRLKLAKRLLNPENSVLIVTIDEKEVHRLGLLLDQVLPGESRQMVSIVINPNGSARGREMSRVEEYAFFVFLGDSGPSLVPEDFLSGDRAETSRRSVRWEWLLRGGANSRRQDRPNLFFPIYIDPTSKTVVEVGDPLPIDVDRASVPSRDGFVTVWPLKTNGEEGRWRASAEYVRELLHAGHARVGAYDAKADRWSLLYLGKAQIRRIEAGDIEVVGRRPDGSLLLEEVASTRRAPKTVWNRSAHTAGEHGSNLLKRFIGARNFPFPKSLYAVEDCLRIAVQDKPNALVVDFFGGSGTTAHAVMRLNRQDGGQRRSIVVTNNEVGAEEQAGLRKRGLRPGDPDWEALGICDYITKPRLRAAVTGKTPDGQPVKGDYKFVDEFPMAQGFEENIEFFTMTYEASRMVAHNRAFQAVSPLLWVKAGSQGSRIEKATEDFAIADTYAVLFDLDHTHEFLAAITKVEALRTAFIVTDDDRAFQMVCAELPPEVEPVRLYESYLTNFAINTGRE